MNEQIVLSLGRNVILWFSWWILNKRSSQNRLQDSKRVIPECFVAKGVETKAAWQHREGGLGRERLFSYENSFEGFIYNLLAFELSTLCHLNALLPK